MAILRREHNNYQKIWRDSEYAKTCFACNTEYIERWHGEMSVVDQITYKLVKGYYTLLEDAICLYVDFDDLTDLQTNAEIKYVNSVIQPGEDWSDVLRFYFKSELAFVLQQRLSARASDVRLPKILQISGFAGAVSFRVRTKQQIEEG